MKLKEKIFLTLQHCLPQHFLSRCVGKIANCENTSLKNFLIKQAIKYFSISLGESLRKDVNQFNSFNDFFTRELDFTIRKIANGKDEIISPADGKISQYGKITKYSLLQAKGKQFSLLDLLAGDREATDQLQDGDFITIYLSPRDYHRVHMPCDGRLIKMTYVPGKLFSVNPLTSNNVDNLFARNERVICVFETDFGLISVVFVGALLVASIVTKWHGIVSPTFHHKAKSWDYSKQNYRFNKGDEIGHFQFGSTVICCFPQNQLTWNENIHIDKEIKMGHELAKLVISNPEHAN